MEIFSVSEESELLQNIKKLAKGNSIKRTDDNYLKRFLIGHEYDVPSAFTALQNYQSFIDRRRDTWLKVDRKKLKTILESQVIDVLENNGRLDQIVVWIRIEKWDTHKFSADEILETSGLICEAIYSKVQKIKCVDVIMDLNNFSFQHLYALSTRFARRMVFFLGECLPMKMLNFYVIRQPRIFCLLYAVFKPLIIDNDKIEFHTIGYNLKPMIENIGLKVLPQELGGLCIQSFSGRWIDIVTKTKTQKDLLLSGYKFLN